MPTISGTARTQFALGYGYTQRYGSFAGKVGSVAGNFSSMEFTAEGSLLHYRSLGLSNVEFDSEDGTLEFSAKGH